MHWVALTVLSIFARASYSIAAKVLTGRVKVSPQTQSIVVTAFAAVFSLSLSPLLGGISFHGIGGIWIVCLLMILSHASGNVLFFKGVEKLDAGTAQIAFASILVWGTLLSPLVLGSHFSPKQGAGVLLLLSAIVCTQYRKGLRSLNAHVLYIVAAAGLFSIFQITSAKLALVMSPATYMFLAYVGSTVFPFALYFRRVVGDLRALTASRWTVVSLASFTGGTNMLYFLFSFCAYRSAPDRGVVVILLTSQVVLSVILGMVFLKERERMGRKLAAGVTAVLAAMLIKS